MNDPFLENDVVDTPPLDHATFLSMQSTDNLICSIEQHKKREIESRNIRLSTEAELVRRAERDIASRTSRVRGERRRIKIEWPEDSWDQSQLKEVWHAFPDLRDEFLAINSLRVRIREYNKMLREHGPEQFEMFKNMVKAANRGPQGLPRVTIEE